MLNDVNDECGKTREFSLSSITILAAIILFAACPGHSCNLSFTLSHLLIPDNRNPPESFHLCMPELAPLGLFARSVCLLGLAQIGGW
jgi:hypothetical protein